MHARREAGCEGLPGAVPLDCVASHCDILCSVQSRRAASIWQHELGAGARIGRCCHVTVACGSGKDPCCLAWGEQRDGDLGRRRRRTGRREHQPPRHRQRLKKILRRLHTSHPSGERHGVSERKLGSCQWSSTPRQAGRQQYRPESTAYI
jgi:hypothetical protein